MGFDTVLSGSFIVLTLAFNVLSSQQFYFQNQFIAPTRFDYSRFLQSPAAQPPFSYNNQFLKNNGFGTGTFALPQQPQQFLQSSLKNYRLPPSVNLFTPNTIQQPAETPGQIENYRKALEEEAKDNGRVDQQSNGNGNTESAERDAGVGENKPKFFVDVKLQGKSYNYFVK